VPVFSKDGTSLVAYLQRREDNDDPSMSAPVFKITKAEEPKGVVEEEEELIVDE